jgi:hypothetical protein
MMSLRRGGIGTTNRQGRPPGYVRTSTSTSALIIIIIIIIIIYNNISNKYVLQTILVF